VVYQCAQLRISSRLHCTEDAGGQQAKRHENPPAGVVAMVVFEKAFYKEKADRSISLSSDT
jgi:hypothetical protein